jgi:integrase
MATWWLHGKGDVARPSKAIEVDLTQPQELTAGLIDRLRCPVAKTQAFLRDTKAPALRVRVTAAGAKSFVFEAKLNRQTVRRTIGDVRAWSIDAARVEANRQRVLVDGGIDPRELERQQHARKMEQKAADAVQAVSAAEAWAEYVKIRSIRWGELHRIDHDRMSKKGGVKANRGTRGRGVTVAGPLFPLLALKLRDLTPSTITAWAAEETRTRPTPTRLAWRLLRGFLSWCAEHPHYSKAVPSENAAKTKVVREALGRAKPKQDSLQREQLEPWFAAVRQLSNVTAAAYLQTLLLTGARPGEVLTLRWADVDAKWKSLTIRDKVEGVRIIPLTPYVAHLLAPLPRVNAWVFASPSRVELIAGNAISKPHKPHKTACTVAGIDGLTLHGLRRSFKSLTEWVEIPAGVVAQLMGHKPSATAEKHYTVRSLDLLRMHHERIETWILGQAGVPFVANVDPGKLRAVN